MHWVAGGFCLFQWLKRKKKPRKKKNNFQSYWNKYVRGGLSEVKWKKKTKPATKHQEKSPVLIQSGRSNLTWNHFFSSWVRSKMKCCLKWKFAGLFWEYQNTTWFSYTSLPLRFWPWHVSWAWLKKLRFWEWGKLSFVYTLIVLLWSLWTLR